MIYENILLRPSNDPLNIGILVLDDSNTLSLAAAVDPLRATNRRAGRALFRWTFYSVTGNPVSLTSGITVETAPIALFSGDLLLIVAGFNLRDHATKELSARLRTIADRSTTVCGIDGGSWIMAAARLLNGHVATCHWEDHEDFAANFPQVNLVPDRYTLHGQFWTTGGATPCIDMLLHIIGCRFGRRLSERVASAFVYDPILAGDSPQQRISTARMARSFPRIARAITWMERNLESPISIAQLAKQEGISTRKLEIEFKQATGQTPGAYFLDLRLAEARRRVIESNATMQDIALATGFNSQSSFARAFRLAYGQSASNLRLDHRTNPSS